MKILLIVLLYLEFSFLEVFWHKVIMHNKPDSFVRKWGIYDDTHIKNEDKIISFGPFIAIGSIISFIFSEQILGLFLDLYL